MRGNRIFAPVLLFVAMVVVGLVISALVLGNRGAGHGAAGIVYRTLTPTPDNILAYVGFPPAGRTLADGSNGMSIVITPENNQNCTYSLFYWAGHPERWPAQIVIGGRSYTSQELKPLLEFTFTDMPALLVREAYGVFMNIRNGADPTGIENTVIQASAWLSENPPGSTPSELSVQTGRAYLNAMQQFNEGVIGPGLCPDNPPTPTPNLIQAASPQATPTPTPTAQPTNTQPRPMITPRPYESPTPPPRHDPTHPPLPTQATTATPEPPPRE